MTNKLAVLLLAGSLIAPSALVLAAVPSIPGPNAVTHRAAPTSAKRLTTANHKSHKKSATSVAPDAVNKPQATAP